jgi:hypothetical protein
MGGGLGATSLYVKISGVNMKSSIIFFILSIFLFVNCNKEEDNPLTINQDLIGNYIYESGYVEMGNDSHIKYLKITSNRIELYQESFNNPGQNRGFDDYEYELAISDTIHMWDVGQPEDDAYMLYHFEDAKLKIKFDGDFFFVRTNVIPTQQEWLGN